MAKAASGANRNSIEFAKCSVDPAYFTDTYGVIDDAQDASDDGGGGGTTRFRLWPAQCRVLWQFMAGRLFIILKARQLGISWLCCSYALWLCVFQPGRVVLCFSQGATEAQELLRRIQVLFERLPEWMLAQLPKLVSSNTTVLEWSNGSKARSLPATQRAGRSFTASLVILDEAAFLMWGTQLYTALKPTIDGGGQLIVLSTANGEGNLFHQLWTKCEEGKNKFCAIFLPWWSRPGRDAAWYDAQVAEATDPNQVKQEYPASAQEAFVASGNVRFAKEWVDKQAPNIAEPIALPKAPTKPRSTWKDADERQAAVAALDAIPGLRFYKLPDPTRDYLVTSDVAEGGEEGDNSTALVIDTENREEVACWFGKCEPDTLADYDLLLATAFRGEYAQAKIAIERNNHGHAVLLALKMKGAQRVALGHDKKRGWLTRDDTKSMTISGLAKALRDGSIIVRTAAAVSEMGRYKTLKDGGTGAPTGYHDDLVMTWAIAIIIANRGRVLTEDDVA